MAEEGSTIRILNALTPVSLEDFDDRLKLQKLVFLARKMGYPIGYSFSWYARGPYSPSLTRMLFSANEQDQLALADPVLTADEAGITRVLREFLGSDVSNPRMLELLASVWYFMRKRTYSPPEKSTLIQKILQRKPQFTEDDVERAIDRIQEFRGG